MKTRGDNNIGAIYREYIRYNQDEAGQFKLLEDQVDKQSDSELRYRGNFIGHITAAVFIVDKKSRRVLLLEHKVLHRLLQPGGHLEGADESPFNASLREMEEETGLTIEDVIYRQVTPGSDLIPFDIDTHYIPENPKKQEPEHYHHDFRYLFIKDNGNDIEIDENESSSYEWVEWDDFIKEEHFKKVARKIEELSFGKSSLHFFDRVFSKQSVEITTNVHCIAVQHILPSTYNFILYLYTIFNGRLLILAKPKSIDRSIKDRLESMGVKIEVAKRNSDELKAIIAKIKKLDTCIILDIGGYFSETASRKGLPILGIIEDTENGHRKYSDIENSLQYPVISVARSELKKNEDALVGRSVVHATDSILRYENKLLEYMNCTVIGYGKIGSGITSELQNKRIRPVVVEKNPMRAIAAIRNGCYLSNLDNAIKDSKVIFSATGSGSLSSGQFRKVRNGAYLVSVTSSDDEFRLDYLHSEYEKKIITEYITKYSNEHNYFYLVNKGDAVNFLFNAALDRYIYLVQADIIVGITDLISKKHSTHKILSVTGEKYDEDIAQEWLKEFTN